ncbi:MAG: ABC transporter ATP-binding protein [Bacteroidales bacterium]
MKIKDKRKKIKKETPCMASPRDMIKVENLEFSYPGTERDVLRNISFSVDDGEIFGFLGPSGAGKSTTQKVLNGILRDYRGSVIVSGREISTIDNSFYEKIGVAFETPNLYNRLTAIENLKLYGAFYSGETEDPGKLLEMVGLYPDRNSMVETFSKGMKVRLNFVRALLNRPKILFLDEPTAGLDPTNARKLKDIILDLKSRGCTIFITTHNMSDVDELCDRLAFIVEGELPVVDTPHSLKLIHGRKLVRVEYLENGIRKAAEFGIEKLGSEKEFLGIISRGNIETIHTLEATLESIFIKVTGKILQ